MYTRLLMLFMLPGLVAGTASSADWTRFRGPNGSGIGTGDALPPQTRSDSENVKWKTALPGPGLSSPIVVGDRVVVTCWSGYAVDPASPGSPDDLKRNVVCLDRATGDIQWQHVQDPVLPEDTYRGMFAQNGYASHTPVTDGARVYAFFGKTGVVALDLTSGQKLWQKSVGENLEGKGWGSASSPILYRDTVIVPAFIEGDSLVAINGETGAVVWEQKTPGYRGNWSTPILVEANDRTDLVLAVPGEVWGLNPESGKLRWYCEVPGSDSARASVIAHGDVVIAMAGGRGANTSIAVPAGGKGDVQPLWTGRDVSGIGTPVIHDGTMYLVSDKVATSVNLEDGRRIAQTRLTGAAAGGQPARGAGDRGAQQGGRGRGGYGGGPGGGRDYSSPVVAGNHLFYASRSGDVFVVELGEKMTQIARNSFESDRTDFSATPAIADGQLFIRSSKSIYCIAAEK